MTKEFISKNLLTVNGGIYSQSLKKLNIKKSIEELYCIYHNINKKPKCEYCNKQRKFLNFVKGYSETCDRSCEGALVKRKQTNLATYGVENLFQSEEKKEKIKQTNLEKYGFENAAQSQTVKNKIRETSIKNNSYNKSREKRENTCLERYGDKFYNNRKKYKNTCLELYGCDNAGAFEEIKKKRENTCFERHGYTNPFYSSVMQQAMNIKAEITKNSIEWKETVGKEASIKMKITKNSIEWKETVGKGAIIKMRTTMENRKKWIPLSEYDNYKLYQRVVWKITNKQNIKDLENNDKRGRGDVENAYHLDHKFSMKEGFERNILPIYIGNIKNLEFIPAKQNIIKGSKCSICEEDLF